MRRSGKPRAQRYGTPLVWLALMPLGWYTVDSSIGGGSTLYRSAGRARLYRSPWPVVPSSRQRRSMA